MNIFLQAPPAPPEQASAVNTHLDSDCRSGIELNIVVITQLDSNCRLGIGLNIAVITQLDSNCRSGIGLNNKHSGHHTA